MSEINLRIANFFKILSMFTVIGSLIYMYAYVTESLDILGAKNVWYQGISKTQIFYVGLGFFAVYNLVMNLAINMYIKVQGIDGCSILFKSEHQKYNLQIWFTYLLVGGNLFMTSLILYLAMVKINLPVSTSAFIYLPLTGAVILSGILLGMILQLLKK